MWNLKFLLLFAIIILFSSSFVSAMPANLYWHANDYYSIEFSGSGNAFVVGSIQLEALSPQPVNVINLEIPYTGVTFYKIVQNGGYYRPPCFNFPCQNGPCAPCETRYLPSVFLNYTTQTLSDSTVVSVTLAYPLQNDTATNIDLIFSTKNVADKNFQGFQFNFKTVEDPNALIRSLSADVVVPQNMYLKGKPSFDIQYRPSDVATQALSSTNAETFVSAYPIRYGGGQFTANNLQPGESFTISGLYGDNLILLYAQEIGIAVGGFIILIVIVKYYLGNKVRGVFEKKSSEEKMSPRRGNEFSFARALIVGFLSSLIFIAVYYLLNIVFQNGYYGGGVISGMTILVINAIFVILSIFGLPYYLYSQYNRSEGVAAAIISLILSFVLLIFLLPQYSPPILYGLANAAKSTLTNVASSGTTSPQ